MGKKCFENGISPNDYFKDRPLIYELIREYPRGPKFKECIAVFADYGLNFDDKDAIRNEYTFVCAFTPLYKVSLLHICAEYNHLACAETLVKHGADINVKAGIDENGFGGQSPISHTVNQNSNKCINMMNFLISQTADLTLTVKRLI